MMHVISLAIYLFHASSINAQQINGVCVQGGDTGGWLKYLNGNWQEITSQFGAKRYKQVTCSTDASFCSTVRYLQVERTGGNYIFRDENGVSSASCESSSSITSPVDCTQWWGQTPKPGIGFVTECTFNGPTPKPTSQPIDLKPGESNGICVTGGTLLLKPINGIWKEDGTLNGAKKYTQITCSSDDSSGFYCQRKRTLALNTAGGYYIFTDNFGASSAYCTQVGIPAADMCTTWSHNNIISVKHCPYTPAPTPAPTDVTSAPTPAPPFKYNLIHPYPECVYAVDPKQRYCKDMYVTEEEKAYITHPNYAERAHHTLMNMARLFPIGYRDSQFGLGTSTPDKYDTANPAKDNFCAMANPVPHYYNNKMNQMGRFSKYDESKCTVPGMPAHATCPENRNPTNGVCRVFATFAGSKAECSQAARSYAFLALAPTTSWDDEFIKAEGGCGLNGCYLDGHCSAAFAPNRCDDVKNTNCRGSFGIGLYPGANGMMIEYGRDNLENYHNYPIVYGAHLDDIFIWNPDSKYVAEKTANKIRFILQWYGTVISDTASNVYLLYKNSKHTMSLMENLGNSQSGFYNVEFDMNDSCEPYSFIVETVNGRKYRLPEDPNYYFGTSFFNIYTKDPKYKCNENHYYKNEQGIWIQNNGFRNLYTTNAGCIGCSKIQKLLTLE